MLIGGNLNNICSYNSESRTVHCFTLPMNKANLNGMLIMVIFLCCELKMCVLHSILSKSEMATLNRK